VPAYRDDLGECDYRLADLDRRAGRLSEAAAGFGRSWAIREPLAGAWPEQPRFAINAAGDAVGLARTAYRAGRLESAVDWADRAVGLLETTPSGTSVVAGDLLRDALRVRAAAQVGAGRPAEALADWRRLRGLTPDAVWVTCCQLAESGLPTQAAMVGVWAELVAE
jgi:tetratricopeptide (TPR) repeat protein